MMLNIIVCNRKWLTDSIPNEAIHISGLNFVSKDRTVTRGGSVAIYIKEEISVNLLNVSG